jgi:hypothetical protein
LGVGEGSSRLDEPAEAVAPTRIAAGDGVDRPPGPGQRHAERGPDGARADDPDDRRLAGRGVLVRMGVVAGVHDVTVPVHPGRGRRQVDPGRLELPDGLAARAFLLMGGTLGIVSRQVSPWPHLVVIRAG